MHDEVTIQRVMKNPQRVEQFLYLGTNITNQNSIQEEIKSLLKSGNSCYLSMQFFLSLSLLSKNTMIMILANRKTNLSSCSVWV